MELQNNFLVLFCGSFECVINFAKYFIYSMLTFGFGLTSCYMVLLWKRRPSFFFFCFLLSQSYSCLRSVLWTLLLLSFFVYSFLFSYISFWLLCFCVSIRPRHLLFFPLSFLYFVVPSTKDSRRRLFDNICSSSLFLIDGQPNKKRQHPPCPRTLAACLLASLPRWIPVGNIRPPTHISYESIFCLRMIEFVTPLTPRLRLCLVVTNGTSAIKADFDFDFVFLVFERYVRNKSR